MKKKLVTYLLISALAVAIFSSCGKRDEDGDAPAADAADAGTVENIVTGDAPEEDIVGKTVETVEDTVEAGTIEAVAAAKAAAEMNEDADTSETAVEANTDATGKEAAEAVDTAAEMSEDADTSETAVEANTDATGKEAAEAADTAATDEPAENVEKVVPENGTTYEVRFGGNIYSTPREYNPDIQYFTHPGEHLIIVERIENTSWYKVHYWLTGEGIEHEGYIVIE